MYLIYQNEWKVWVLRIRSGSLLKEHKFNKYINALDAAQALRFLPNKYDRRGQVLRKAG